MARDAFTSTAVPGVNRARTAGMASSTPANHCASGSVSVRAFIFSPTATVSMPVFRSDISFGLASVPVGVVFFVLCGLCTSVMWGGLFNLAVEGLGKYTSVGSGIFMVMVCGGGILPLIQGYVADLGRGYDVQTRHL